MQAEICTTAFTPKLENYNMQKNKGNEKGGGWGTRDAHRLKNSLRSDCLLKAGRNVLTVTALCVAVYASEIHPKALPFSVSGLSTPHPESYGLDAVPPASVCHGSPAYRVS